MTNSRIIIPDNFMGINTAEAYRRVMEESRKPKAQAPKNPNPLTVNPEIVSHDYIQIPGISKVISKFEVQGYNNADWQNTHFELHENGLYMPTIPEFIAHFINVLDSYKSKGKKPLFDAAGNPISEKDTEDIYLHLTKDHIAAYGQGTSKGAWTHLDAKFEDQGGMKMLSEHRIVIDNGNKTLVPGKIENLEACLMQDGFADLAFNRQGLPTQASSVQSYEQGRNIYFWHPRNERVAWFGAFSGWAALSCSGIPSVRVPSLGVFAVREAGGNAS